MRAKQVSYNFRFRPLRGVGAWVYEGGKGGARVAWCDSRALVPLSGSIRPMCMWSKGRRRSLHS